jgi:NADPH-dependent curcumin reductase CurA
MDKNGTAYVSGAAGAVGMIAGQILKKVYGLNRVIGSAGSDDKVKVRPQSKPVRILVVSPFSGVGSLPWTVAR